jgi:hypothetical protein
MLYRITKISQTIIVALGERGITSDEQCVVELSINTDTKSRTNCVQLKNIGYSVAMLYEGNPYIVLSDINGKVWIYSPNINALFDLNKLNRHAPKPALGNTILESMFLTDLPPDIFIIQDSSYNQYIVKMDFDDYSKFKPEITKIKGVFILFLNVDWHAV